jgi:hypothetical protein
MATSPNPDLGKKFTCFKCECKFYDLGRPEPLCPRCGADQREDPSPDPSEAYVMSRRRGRKPKTKRPTPKVIEAPVDEGGDMLDDDPDEAAEEPEKGK